MKGVLNVTLKSGSWRIENCKILLVNNLTQNFIGRDILQQLGIHLTASKPTGKAIGLISDTAIEQNIIKWIFRKYPHICTRLGCSKNHRTESTFKETFNPTQHQGRRVPLHLLERVEKELEQLIEDQQIFRLEKNSGEYFISPVVITLKKDKNVKIALNLSELRSTNCTPERSTNRETFLSSKLHLKNAYSQIPLGPHCKNIATSIC